MTGTAGMPAMGAPGGQSPLVMGNPPSDWAPQPLTEMRQASFLVKGDNGATADISLVTLPGAAGGALENINRWLKQLGKPEVTEEQLAQMAQHVTSPLGDVTVVDIEGLPQGADMAKDGRILGGIASTSDKTYFFKMRGNAALVEAQKAAFIQWIGGISDSTNVNTASEGVFDQGPVAATGSMGAAQAPEAAPEKPQIKWDVPADWKPVPPTAMRYASFAFPGADGESSDVSVSVFDGDGGGDLENVNRWRGQAGLDPITADGLQGLIVPVICKDGDILTVDMAGPKARILAGWARTGGRTWFFKLTPAGKLAAAGKAEFAKFLQSVEFHP